MSVRRESLWKYVGFSLAAILLIAGGFSLWIQTVASRRWEALEQGSADVLAEIHRRPSNRPPPRGTALEGDAWQDYQATIAAMLQMGEADRIAILEFRRRRNPNTERPIADVLAAKASIIEDLRRAAHRTRFESQVGNAGFDRIEMFSQSAAYVIGLVGCRAQQLAESGRLPEAVECALDYHRVTRDFVEMIGEPAGALGTYSEALRLLNEFLQNDALPGDLLAELDRELGQAEDGLPTYEAFLTRQEWEFSRTLLNPAKALRMVEEWNGNPSESLWRFGFSNRIRCAAAFDASRDMTRKLLQISARPWHEHQILLKHLQGELSASSNAIARCLTFFVYLDTDRRFREIRARLHVTRVAARFRLRGEILDLEDPFGTRVQTRRTGESLRVWSVGLDGNDDLGANEDIVLDVKR